MTIPSNTNDGDSANPEQVGGRGRQRSLWINLGLALIAAIAIGLSLTGLLGGESEVEISYIDVGKTPTTVFRPVGAPASPVVVIAHGFAGSQQLMQPIALAAAQNGYIAVTFDFPGHGHHPYPLTGSLTDTDATTNALVAELQRLVDVARTLGNGKVAVLGHSIASDIVVRAAQASPDIGATIAVSMVSPTVTATSPKNLLIIVGEWEATLTKEALRVAALSNDVETAEPGVTYGDKATGTARRVAVSPHVEHASVLFSQHTMRETVQWLDLNFGPIRPPGPLDIPARGGWIILLILGVVLLARPLSQALPKIVKRPIGAGMSWRRIWLPMAVPMLATPLVLWILPTQFLPILIADYLAAHFAVYGLMTIACMRWVQRKRKRDGIAKTIRSPFVASSAVVIAYGFVALVWPIDSFITSFLPGPGRGLLLAIMLLGTLSYFIADEWMTRGPASGRFSYTASKVAFLISLAIAVSLDFDRLFFLIIIVPVILLFFLIYGLISTWIYRRTGHPLIAALANAVAFAWAIGVTFPLLAG